MKTVTLRCHRKVERLDQAQIFGAEDLFAEQLIDHFLIAVRVGLAGSLRCVTAQRLIQLIVLVFVEIDLLILVRLLAYLCNDLLSQIIADNFCLSPYR